MHGLQCAREQIKGRGTDDGISTVTAETSAETILNLENLCLDIDLDSVRESRYVMAVLNAFHSCKEKLGAGCKRQLAMQDIVQHWVSQKIRLQGGQVSTCSANTCAKFQDGWIDSGTSCMSTIG